tara:strand:- start:143 stop:760 length:618 start_codon:yes stop_codon:yes gene_type:complete
MEWVSILLKTIPVIAKQKTKTITTILLVIFLTVLTHTGDIKEYFFKKDIAKEYLLRGRRVELSLHTFKKDYKCDAVSIAILHNGVVSIADPQFHLMKFSVLFSVGENARNTKTIYVNQPLSIWMDNFVEMLHKGYFLIKDGSTDLDPLVRRVYDSTKMKTSLYLPMYKNDLLIGYAILSWGDKKDITKKYISSMKRSLMDVESKL